MLAWLLATHVNFTVPATGCPGKYEPGGTQCRQVLKMCTPEEGGGFDCPFGVIRNPETESILSPADTRKW
eukprot:g32046.t1